jgi:hypothetical protein
MNCRWIVMVVASLGAGACGGDREREVAVQDTLARDLELPPTDSVAPADTMASSKAGARTELQPADSGRAKTRASTRVKPRVSEPPKVRASRPTVPKADTASAADTATAAGYAPATDRSDTLVGYARDSAAGIVSSAELDSAAGAASTRPDSAGTAPAPAREPPAPAPTPTPASSQATPPPAVPAPTTAAPPTTPTAPAPAPPAAAPVPANALAVGTVFRAQMQDSINSLRNSAGQTVTATVSGDVRAPDGLTVLPTGAKVHVFIERLRPARSRSAKDGELQLRVDSITVGGHTYAVRADVGPVPHELRGRGVTAGEVEKVGAGAAAGAVVGGVVTGKTKGAVIGGVIGAAGGTVVAAQTASRDVVVTPGTLLTLVLRQPVTRVQR